MLPVRGEPWLFRCHKALGPEGAKGALGRGPELFVSFFFVVGLGLVLLAVLAHINSNSGGNNDALDDLLPHWRYRDEL